MPKQKRVKPHRNWKRMSKGKSFTVEAVKVTPIKGGFKVVNIKGKR